MTAVQQYWLLGGGGLFASRFYPLATAPEALLTAATLLSTRVLTYNPDNVEPWSSAAALIAAQLGGADRWEIRYQASDPITSAAVLLAASYTAFQQVSLGLGSVERFQSSALLLSGGITQFARVGLDTQPLEAFASDVLLVGALSSTTRVPLQSQAPEAFSSAAALIAANLQTETNACGVLGPFDLCFNVVPDGTANLDLNSTQ